MRQRNRTKKSRAPRWKVRDRDSRDSGVYEKDNGIDLHKADQDFIAIVRTATDDELKMLHRFQAVQDWQRIVIQREVDRRKK